MLYNALLHDYVFDTIDEGEDIEKVGPYLYRVGFAAGRIPLITIKRKVTKQDGSTFFVGVELRIPLPTDREQLVQIKLGILSETV
jgi:hypothetical protein